MATLNGNNAYLAFNSVNLSGYWTEQIDKSVSNDAQEITAGAGVTHKQRAAGLNDNSISFSVVYDDTNLSSIRTALVIGTTAVLTYGPEGQTSGKPKFECSMILKEVKGPNLTIDKQKVMFELSFDAAAAPTSTIEGGSTF